MKGLWLWHAESDSVLIGTEKDLETGWVELLGDCKTGTISEITEILSKHEGFLATYKIEDLFDKNTWLIMNEKELMIEILDRFVQVSETLLKGT